MTYKESVHRHQSDKLKFLPKDYTPYQKFKEKNIYGVVGYKEGSFEVNYQSSVPKFGGYISEKENIYGNPAYCRNATRNHLRHLKEYNSMPHLIFFADEATAQKAGFRKCKVCVKD